MSRCPLPQIRRGDPSRAARPLRAAPRRWLRGAEPALPAAAAATVPPCSAKSPPPPGQRSLPPRRQHFHRKKRRGGRDSEQSPAGAKRLGLSCGRGGEPPPAPEPRRLPPASCVRRGGSPREEAEVSYSPVTMKRRGALNIR